MRKLLLNLHLYAALITGVFVAILGATGSVMAFEDQLDHLSHPHLFYVTPQGAPLSLADLAAAAGRRFPGERADVLRDGGDVRTSRTTSSFDSGNVYVNPYTGEVLGVRNGPTFLSVRAPVPPAPACRRHRQEDRVVDRRRDAVPAVVRAVSMVAAQARHDHVERSVRARCGSTCTTPWASSRSCFSWC